MTEESGAHSRQIDPPYDELLSVLRSRRDWVPARDYLAKLAEHCRTDVDELARSFSTVYTGKRAAMVVDVVLSTRRNYEGVVLPTIQDWMVVHPAMPLAELAANGPGAVKRLRADKRADDATTIREVAKGLSQYCLDAGLEDEAGVKAWAQSVDPLRYVWRADCYVGGTRGIGIALFAYLRMRAGADAIKPDTRVYQALQKAGLVLPENEPTTWLLLAEGMAAELRISRLWLDQMLWYVKATSQL